MSTIKILPDIKVLNDFVQNAPTPQVEDISLIVSYAFRAKIIADRYTRGFERADTDGGKGAFITSGKPIFQTERDENNKRMAIEMGDGRSAGIQTPAESYSYEQPRAIENYKKNDGTIDAVYLIDIDYKGGSGRGYEYIKLPFIPRELDYQPTSKFVGIATMGRNNPHYHFTGSEDSLTFEIDWFSAMDNRQDVIESCRWVEALSKADGYDDMPHRVKLQWGYMDLLFAGVVWVVTEASYKLTDFVKAYRDPDSGNIVKVGMMPQQAYQKVTLKRLTKDNLKSSEIINATTTGDLRTIKQPGI